MTTAPDRPSPLDGHRDELAIQREGLAAIRAGRHLTVTELGRAAGLEPTRAQVVIDSLLARQAATVIDGRVDGIAGLTTRPTKHTLTIDGDDRYTWCAFDAVGIPAALGLDAVAATRCGHCGETIVVTFTAGHAPAAEPWGWLPRSKPAATGSSMSSALRPISSATATTSSSGARWLVRQLANLTRSAISPTSVAPHGTTAVEGAAGAPHDSSEERGGGDGPASARGPP